MIPGTEEHKAWVAALQPGDRVSVMERMAWEGSAGRHKYDGVVDRRTPKRVHLAHRGGYVDARGEVFPRYLDYRRYIVPVEPPF